MTGFGDLFVRNRHETALITDTAGTYIKIHNNNNKNENENDNQYPQNQQHHQEVEEEEEDEEERRVQNSKDSSNGNDVIVRILTGAGVSILEELRADYSEAVELASQVPGVVRVLEVQSTVLPYSITTENYCNVVVTSSLPSSSTITVAMAATPVNTTTTNSESGTGTRSGTGTGCWRDVVGAAAGAVMTVGSLLEAFSQVCAVVASLHALGVTHGNLRPTTLHVDVDVDGEEGQVQVRVGDVGFLRTRRAYFKLLPHRYVSDDAYVAPELKDWYTQPSLPGGEAGVQTVGPAVDVYALCALLSQLLDTRDADIVNRDDLRDLYRLVEQGRSSSPEARPMLSELLVEVRAAAKRIATAESEGIEHRRLELLTASATTTATTTATSSTREAVFSPLPPPVSVPPIPVYISPLPVYIPPLPPSRRSSVAVPLDAISLLAQLSQQHSNHAQLGALIDLYIQLGGPSWRLSKNWLTSTPLNEWHGVSLDAAGDVMTLDLRDNNLIGELPASFGSMTSLQRLYLQGNHISGCLPSRIGDLSHLLYLDIDMNDFSGALPASFANLKSLQILSLRENKKLATSKGEIRRLLPDCEDITI